MAIKILVNPFDPPTSSPKHETGIIVTDPRGGAAGSVQTYQDVLPVSGTDAVPTAVTIRKPGAGYAPDAEYQYVRNADTDSIIAGSAVTYTLGATDDDVAVEFVNGTGVPIAGIAVRTIPTLQYAWIQVRGLVPVPSTSSNTDAELRGGVRVSPTNIATNSILGGSGTDGVLVARAVTTDASNMSGLAYALTGRRILTVDTGLNLATAGGTDGRAESIIF